MPITDEQKQSAQDQQFAAARDNSPAVRVIAGPGTGKSHTIQERVRFLLSNRTEPDRIQVISFTRATCAELNERVFNYCSNTIDSSIIDRVKISTMHSLALTMLRRANLLSHYPSNPAILDDWELKNIYDREFATNHGCTPTRAKEIRSAYDAMWETLSESVLAQRNITFEERESFTRFHGIRSNLYSCILPGEVIHKCVQSINMGELHPRPVVDIDHLVVDEFQDLNACDQEFIRLISSDSVILLIAGDDDQSIYSFRHANPDGIVSFARVYNNSSSHTLTACFRCSPSVLYPALKLINHNPNRISKDLESLYQSATPPVDGTLSVLSFTNADVEAKAVAESCASLISAGMEGNEDDIVILLSAKSPSSIQLDPITRELGNLGIPFTIPRGNDIADDPTLRCVYSLLRIISERSGSDPDYPAHRAFLTLMNGVGAGSIQQLVDGCIANNQNFHDLFYLGEAPPWLESRGRAATLRLMGIIANSNSWDTDNTLGKRIEDIGSVLEEFVFNGNNSQSKVESWKSFAETLPEDMFLRELLEYFGARTESDQERVLNSVRNRIGLISDEQSGDPKAIRIMTMHGAKGLSGKIVFIPFAEEGIIPSFRAINAVGLLIESRRLFYVSITRAMAACIISHSGVHRGPAAFAIAQKPEVRLSRSQFLNEMGIPSVNRDSGLTSQEVQNIIQDVNNL